MDGKPVTEIVESDSDPARRDVKHRRPLSDRAEPSRELDEEVQDRLADIGYTARRFVRKYN